MSESESAEELTRATRREAAQVAGEQKRDHVEQHHTVRGTAAETAAAAEALAREGQAASQVRAQTTDDLVRRSAVAQAGHSAEQSALLTALLASVDGLRDAILSTAATKDDVLAAEANAEASRRGLRRISAAGIVALLALASTNVALNARSGTEAQDAASSAALLVDCNTPSTPKDPHPCYDRNQASVTAAVAAIVGRQSTNAAIAVTAGLQCARQHPTLTDIALRGCVLAKLIPLAGVK